MHFSDGPQITQKMAMVSFFLAIVLVLSSSLQGEAAPPAIFVFGDSLADVGNNNNQQDASVKANFLHNGIDFPGEVPTGRFSNGYNGIDYIAMFLGFKQSPPSYLSIKDDTQVQQGVNFASGGSGLLDTTGKSSINFSTQIKNFDDVTRSVVKKLGNGTSPFVAESLFIISDGSNDLVAHYILSAGARNPLHANQEFVTLLVDNLKDRIRALYNRGARKFALLGLSKVGCVPFFRSKNPPGTCIEELNRMARRFNTMAKSQLVSLASELQGMHYSYGNIHDITTELQTCPSDAGLIELKTACCGAGKFNGGVQCTPAMKICPNRDNHLYWDWFHPTQAIYKIVATKQYSGSTSYNTPMDIKQLAGI